MNTKRSADERLYVTIASDAIRTPTVSFSAQSEWPRPLLVKIGGALVRLALDHCRIYNDVTLYDEPKHDTSSLLSSISKTATTSTITKPKHALKIEKSPVDVAIERSMGT
jgi:hypothetical protein